VAYIEKLTWDGKDLTLERPNSPVDAVATNGSLARLEKININDPALRPTNYAKPDGTPLPIFQAEGVRVDLSKRTKEPMNFWHRNLECDELIFCYKGAIHWETELGNMTLQAGEMFVIPRGIAHRSLPPANSTSENIIIELKIRGAITKLV
jgi:mannose-6-phosphate isomerase-like protein (cupin superfamily)